MKRIMVLFTLSLLMLSCGVEEVTVQYAPENNLVSNTTLREKVMRMAQHPTTADDFIDECSCFSVKMPFTVFVNNDEVYVETEADYQQVYDVLSESNYDYDGITFLYPITVIYADYHEEEMSISQYMDAVETCSGAPVEIACAGFVYPVGIKTYESQNALAQSFEVGSKEALYGFLATVDVYDAATFAFPVSVEEPDGSMASIANNSALETAIDGYAAQCEPEYPAEPELIDLIMTGTWHVSYFYNGQDLTDNYSAYSFTFAYGGGATVTGGATAITGYWNYGVSSGFEAVALYNFTGNELNNLEDAWILSNTTSTTINLFLPGNTTVPYFFLEFTKD